VEFWNSLDHMLITFYRITGDPVSGFFLGTFLLALLAVVIGELTISVAYLLNRVHIKALNDRMARMHNLSLNALRSGQKEEYRRSNKEANDAFGRVFFNAVALSAASLWPVFFALSWMQERFMGIDFPVPFTGLTVNYVLIFLICYVLARILFGGMRSRLPYFSKVQKIVDEDAKKTPELESPA